MRKTEQIKNADLMVREGRKLVLYIVENTDNAQFRYRCKNPMEALTSSKEWRVMWLMKDDLEGLEKYLEKASLVIIERQTDKDGRIGKIIDKAHKAGVKVVFDLDDLIFDLRDLPILMKTTNSRNVAYWVGYIWGIRRIATRVDGFICTNDFLAGKLKRSFEKPVQVIRNSLNKAQVEVSEKCIKKKKHDGFVVGYFSGSPTHRKDFAMVETDLVEFLRVHEDAKLRVVGYMKFSDEMRKMIDSGRVEIMGVVDYLKLQKMVAEVDVNIAPLVINEFTNCKSELKFFEAAVVETTTIASPTYTFEKAITDGENGYLARPGEWYERLEYLYKHPDINRKVALSAKKYALKHYYGKAFLEEVEKAYEYFAK